MVRQWSGSPAGGPARPACRHGPAGVVRRSAGGDAATHARRDESGAPGRTCILAMRFNLSGGLGLHY